MPVKISKRGSKYRVSTPNMVHAKGTTKAKAMKQMRLLNAVDHGWMPTGKGAKKHKEECNRVNCKEMN